MIKASDVAAKTTVNSLMQNMDEATILTPASIDVESNPLLFCCCVILSFVCRVSFVAGGEPFFY